MQKRLIFNRKASIQAPLLAALAFGLIGCAGPMTPFGAVNKILPDDTESAMMHNEGSHLLPLDPIGEEKIDLSTAPDRQLWHEKSPLILRIVDRGGVPANHVIMVKYNQRDVTDDFLARARKDVSPDRQSVMYTFPDLRLRAEDTNQIEFAYQRTPASDVIAHPFQEPTCDFTESNESGRRSPFESAARLVESVRRLARSKGVNPSWFAGLIAEESGFNPSKVTWKKTVGLTQINDLVAQFLSARYPEWPQYRPGTRMSVGLFKAKILSGYIHSGNEWRLDEEKAIRGGLEWIEHLRALWERPDDQRLLKEASLTDAQAMGDLLLASYHVGVKRVQESMRQYGRRWLQSAELRDAYRYVRRVRSYCYHFQGAAPISAYLGEDL